MSFHAKLWTRRPVRIVVKTLLVLVALRALVSLVAPFALSRAAASYDLTAEYDELTLSVFGGSAQLTGLVVGERGAPADAPPMLAVDYGLVDVSMLSLLKGELHVERAEIDDVRARIERRKDGSVPWIAHLGLDQAGEPDPEPQAEPEPRAEPEPLDFTPLVRVDALRALRIGVRLIDDSVTPAIDEELVCELRVSDFGVAQGAATFEASASSPRLLGSARAHGRLRGGVRELTCDVDYALDRLHAKPLAGFLRPLGLEPLADDVSLRGAALATVEPVEGSAELCRGTVAVHSVRVDADGEHAFELGELRLAPIEFSASALRTGALRPGRLRIGELRVADLKLAAHRGANGRLAAAGFELAPVAPQAAKDATAPPQPLAFPALSIDVQRVRFERLAVTLDDRAVMPATSLEARLDSLAAVADDADPSTKVFSARFVAPGIFETGSLDGRVALAEPTLAFDATLALFGLRPDALAAHLAALGLASELESGRFSARIAARATIAGGKLSDASTSVGPISLVAKGAAAPGRELLALDRIEVAGLEFDPLARRVDVERIESSGLRGLAVRDAQGALHVAGLRTIAKPVSATAEAASAPGAPSAQNASGGPGAGATAASSAPLELHIAHFSTRDNRLRFVDRAVTPELELATEPLEATLEHLALGARAADPNGADPDGASLVAKLGIPGVLASATLDGRLRPHTEGPGVQFAAMLDAVGVTPARLAPYLAALGLEPVAERLDARAALHFAVVHAGDAWDATVQLVDASVSEGTRELASLGRLEVLNARADAGGALAAAAVSIGDAHLGVDRDAQGRLQVLGLRLVGAPPAADERATAEPSSAEPARAEPNSGALVLPRLDIGRISVNSLALDWSDAAVTPAVATRLTLGATVQPLHVGVGNGGGARTLEQRTTHYSLTADAGADLPRMIVTGTALLEADALGLEAHVSCERLRAGPFAAYLPPGVVVELQDGKTEFDVVASSSRVRALASGDADQPAHGNVGRFVEGDVGALGATEAGRSAEFAIRGVELSDGERSLAKLGRFEVRAARIDPARGVFELAAVELVGAELYVRRAADGSLHAAGLALTTPPEPAPSDATAPDSKRVLTAETNRAPNPTLGAPASADQGVSKSAGGELAPSATGAPSSTAVPSATGATAAASATAATGLARFSLASADLELARLSFVDESLGANAEPLVLATRAKFADVVLAGGSESAPPMRIDVEGSVSPLVDRWTANLALGESDGEPVLDARFALDGLRGDALAHVAPELAATLDGAALANGSVRASAKTHLRATRGANRAPDITRPFGAEIELGPFEFRATPDGEVLAGLESGRIELAKFDPATGDVAIRALELVKPRGRLSRDAKGLHALGVTLRVPAASAELADGEFASDPASSDVTGGDELAASRHLSEATEPVAGVALGTATTPTTPETTRARLASEPEHDSAPARPAPELSIDRFAIHGLDFVVTDATTTPPTVVPLVDLDFELRKFSTRALTEPKALYFNAFVTAGQVELPRRVESDSLLEGFAEAVGGALTGAEDEASTLEARPLFEEIAVAGRVTLHPEIRGWINVGVSALELANFRGIAEAAGLTLGDGVLDETVRVRLQGAQGLSIESRSTFSYLSLSEPADGPISRYLALPAPLDTVLFVMKDAEDQHKVPINVRMSWDGLSTSEIVSAALGAVTQVLARAVASAPLRLLSGVGGLFGDDEPVPPTDDTLTIVYPAGAVIADQSVIPLDALVRRFGSDDRHVFAVQHRFSKADLERAQRLANPSTEACRELSNRLRRTKAELLRRREELAARARVDYAVGRRDAAAAATIELRAQDRELGFNEDALDRVHELLRPGAERRRDQRTKAALVAIAIERVARLKQELVDRGIDPVRIEIRALKAVVDPTLESGRVSITPRKRK
ncbi:MAG: hypothetical protein HZA52_08725 [Planctomycetes bacterium]|nr:hypothetical protein [Planctomycetota bacterium]